MTTPLPCALAAPVCAALCAWSALAAAVPAHAAERAPVTVFVASLQARGDVSADHAALLTGALVREVATLPGRTVVTTRDIEQVLSQERLRQLLDCDSTNCALEMAGQVNAEELVSGTWGGWGPRGSCPSRACARGMPRRWHA